MKPIHLRDKPKPKPCEKTNECDICGATIVTFTVNKSGVWITMRGCMTGQHGIELVEEDEWLEW